MAIISVDLGGTKVSVALFDDLGNIIEKEVSLLSGASGDNAFNILMKTLNHVYNNCAGQIDGIGVCIPGIVYCKTETVWAPNIPGWENYPLKQKIKENIDDDITILIESDRTCYILGEVWKGLAKNCNNAIYLAVGTGIGAGILIDGHVLHGHSDIIGATGWLAQKAPFKKEYIPVGCFEYYASGNGIGLQARNELAKAKNYSGILSKKPLSDITSYDVFSAYEEKDVIATKVINNAIQMWGMGAANLVSIFNPEKIIFGGGIFGPAQKFINAIYKEACKWGQPISMKQVEFCNTKILDNAALLGAAYLVKKQLKSKQYMI